MKLKYVLAVALATSALGFAAVAAQDTTPEPTMPQAGATVMLQDVNGADVGQITFSQNDTGTVVIVATVQGLTAGFHGFHIHETGQCDASGDTPFASAGGHYNPLTASHPDHAGDLPSLLVNADGTGQLMAVTDRFQLADLFDADGSAVVIHSGADNYANIPERYGQPDDETLKAGDSGTRVACGVLQQDAEATVG